MGAGKDIVENMNMKKQGRYETSLLIEDQYAPGSRKRVLKNIQGIKSKREMDDIESRELLRTTSHLIDMYDSGHRFTAQGICFMHHTWLKDIYTWAGRYRSVTMSKGGFTFAAPAFIPRLMDEFERKILSRYTPCHSLSEKELVGALSIVHVELLLIHPFREGNGRVARLLASLMALQAGRPLLDFRSIKGKRKMEYFGAVQAGLSKDYQPMGKIFSDVIRRTLSAF
jgi:cell filamentation protein